MTKNLLEELFDFIETTHKFQKSNAEHSYQLAMVAWYLVTKHKLPLDLTLVIKYSLVHDLSEEKSRELLGEKFPEFKDVHHLINSHSKNTYEESKFIYALDKFLPMINEHKSKGKNLDKLIEAGQDTISKSEFVDRYLKELIKSKSN